MVDLESLPSCRRNTFDGAPVPSSGDGILTMMLEQVEGFDMAFLNGTSFRGHGKVAETG